MKNLYYIIWVDAIRSYKYHHPNNKNWKGVIFAYMTWMNTLNAFIVLLWLKYFKIFTLKTIDLKLFANKNINDFIGFVIYFSLPFVVFNYLLIFYGNRYEKLLIRYNNIKTGYAITYSYIMIFGAFLSAVIYGIIT